MKFSFKLFKKVAVLWCFALHHVRYKASKLLVPKLRCFDATTVGEITSVVEVLTQQHSARVCYGDGDRHSCDWGRGHDVILPNFGRPVIIILKLYFSSCKTLCEFMNDTNVCSFTVQNKSTNSEILYLFCFLV